jgi:hypothetical protein
VYAALSYLSREDQEKYEETDSSLLLHSSIDILCSTHEVSIELEMDDSRKVYDADLELGLQFLRTNKSPSE